MNYKKICIILLSIFILLVISLSFSQIKVKNNPEDNLTLESRIVELETKVKLLESRIVFLEQNIKNPPVKILPCDE